MVVEMEMGRKVECDVVAVHVSIRIQARRATPKPIVVPPPNLLDLLWSQVYIDRHPRNPRSLVDGYS